MKIFINNDYYSDMNSIPKHYENEPKKIVIEVQEDLYDAAKLKNIVSIYLEAIDKTIKVDLSNFKDVEEIYIDYNFGLDKIEGIHELINLRYLGYIGNELDYTYSKLLENILSQIDIPKLLSKPSSYLLLSVFAIPMLKRKYPNFFEDFSIFSDKISFSDATDTFLRGQVFSTCTFEEAKQVELITDKWIHENISHTMNDVEKFARIYEYVLRIVEYDHSHKESDEKHSVACSMAHTLLRGKGICVGYAQLVKYLSLKCGLQCEYTQAELKANYGVKTDESGEFIQIYPKKTEKDVFDCSISNHAIVRFSPDNINWLYSDPTNDSFFYHMALEQNKTLKNLGTFCLPIAEMKLYNKPSIYDYEGNEIKLSSQLTQDVKIQIEDAVTAILSEQKQEKKL